METSQVNALAQRSRTLSAAREQQRAERASFSVRVDVPVGANSSIPSVSLDTPRIQDESVWTLERPILEASVDDSGGDVIEDASDTRPVQRVVPEVVSSILPDGSHTIDTNRHVRAKAALRVVQNALASVKIPHHTKQQKAFTVPADFLNNRTQPLQVHDQDQQRVYADEAHSVPGEYSLPLPYDVSYRLPTQESLGPWYMRYPSPDYSSLPEVPIQQSNELTGFIDMQDVALDGIQAQAHEQVVLLREDLHAYREEQKTRGQSKRGASHYQNTTRFGLQSLRSPVAHSQQFYDSYRSFIEAAQDASVGGNDDVLFQQDVYGIPFNSEVAHAFGEYLLRQPPSGKVASRWKKVVREASRELQDTGGELEINTARLLLNDRFAEAISGVFLHAFPRQRLRSLTDNLLQYGFTDETIAESRAILGNAFDDDATSAIFLQKVWEYRCLSSVLERQINPPSVETDETNLIDGVDAFIPGEGDRFLATVNRRIKVMVHNRYDWRDRSTRSSRNAVKAFIEESQLNGEFDVLDVSSRTAIEEGLQLLMDEYMETQAMDTGFDESALLRYRMHADLRNPDLLERCVRTSTQLYPQTEREIMQRSKVVEDALQEVSSSIPEEVYITYPTSAATGQDQEMSIESQVKKGFRWLRLRLSRDYVSPRTNPTNSVVTTTLVELLHKTQPNTRAQIFNSPFMLNAREDINLAHGDDVPLVVLPSWWSNEAVKSFQETYAGRGFRPRARFITPAHLNDIPRFLSGMRDDIAALEEQANSARNYQIGEEYPSDYPTIPDRMHARPSSPPTPNTITSRMMVDDIHTPDTHVSQESASLMREGDRYIKKLGKKIDPNQRAMLEELNRIIDGGLLDTRVLGEMIYFDDESMNKLDVSNRIVRWHQEPRTREISFFETLANRLEEQGENLPYSERVIWEYIPEYVQNYLLWRSKKTIPQI